MEWVKICKFGGCLKRIWGKISLIKFKLWFFLSLLPLKLNDFLAWQFSSKKNGNWALIKLSVLSTENFSSHAFFKLRFPNCMSNPSSNHKLLALTRIKREHTQTYRTGKSARSMEERNLLHERDFASKSEIILYFMCILTRSEGSSIVFHISLTAAAVACAIRIIFVYILMWLVTRTL